MHTKTFKVRVDFHRKLFDLMTFPFFPVVVMSRLVKLQAVWEG